MGPTRAERMALVRRTALEGMQIGTGSLPLPEGEGRGEGEQRDGLDRGSNTDLLATVEGLWCLDIVYTVYDTRPVPTIVQSCRIEKGHAALLARQAKRRHLEVSTLSSLYLKEKALEEEYPGIGFRDGANGREAHVLGHRVAVWEVVDVYREAKTIAKVAGHFRWPPALVRCALAFAKAFPTEIDQQRQAEVGA